MAILTYQELILIPSYEERFEYLKLDGIVCEETFGSNRFLNQRFYNSMEWRNFRNHIILRDSGCDMAHDDYPISGIIYIHHLNPLTVYDIENDRRCLFDPNNVVCVSKITHEAIHYSDSSLLPKPLIERLPNDTIPWR